MFTCEIMSVSTPARSTTSTHCARLSACQHTPAQRAHTLISASMHAPTLCSRASERVHTPGMVIMHTWPKTVKAHVLMLHSTVSRKAAQPHTDKPGLSSMQCLPEHTVSLKTNCHAGTRQHMR
jgi:hypothetical protein